MSRLAGSFAATALFALAATAMIPADDARAQTHPCAQASNTDCEATITPTRANLFVDGSNTLEFTVNIKGYTRSGPTGAESRAGDAVFVGARMTISGGNSVLNEISENLTPSCVTDNPENCSRSFKTSDLTIAFTGDTPSSAFFLRDPSNTNRFRIGAPITAFNLDADDDVSFTISVTAGGATTDGVDRAATAGVTRTFGLESVNGFTQIGNNGPAVGGFFGTQTSGNGIQLPSPTTNAGTATFNVVPPTYEITGENAILVLNGASATFDVDINNYPAATAGVGDNNFLLAAVDMSPSAGNVDVVAIGSNSARTLETADFEISFGSADSTIFFLTGGPGDFQVAIPSARFGDNTESVQINVVAKSDATAERVTTFSARQATLYAAVSGTGDPSSEVSGRDIGTDDSTGDVAYTPVTRLDSADSALMTLEVTDQPLVPAFGSDPASNDYSVVLPYQAGAADQTAAITTTLATANDGAHVRLCVAGSATGVLGAAGAGGTVAASGDITGIGPFDRVILTVYVTAETVVRAGGTPNDCDDAATAANASDDDGDSRPNGNVTAYTVTITVAPVEAPTLSTLKVQLTTGGGGDNLDLISYMSDTFTYAVGLDETEITDRTDHRSALLRYEATGSGANYTLFCRGNTIEGGSSDDIFAIPLLALPERGQNFDLNVYVIHADNFVTSGASDVDAGRINPRNTGNPGNPCADALRASARSYVSKYIVNISRLPDRTASATSELSGLAVMGRTLLNDAGTEAAPNTFVPANLDYSVDLPFGSTGVDIDATLPPESIAAAILYCSTSGATVNAITGAVSGLTAGTTATISIHVTAETVDTAYNCANIGEAAAATTTTYTLAIEVAPAATGTAQLNNAGGLSLLNSDGSTVNVPLVLTSIPATVYDGEKLVSLSEVNVSIGLMKGSAAVTYNTNSRGASLDSVGNTTFSVGSSDAIFFSNATAGFDVHVPVAALGAAPAGTYTETVTLTFTTDDGTVTAGEDVTLPANLASLEAVTYSTGPVNALVPADSTSTPAAGSLTLADGATPLFTVDTDEFPRFADTSDQQDALVWSTNTNISETLPTIVTASGVNTPIIYSLAGPALPGTVVFDGTISPPTLMGDTGGEIFDPSAYTLTACDAQNDCTNDDIVSRTDNEKSVTFTIEVRVGPPSTVFLDTTAATIDEDGGMVTLTVSLNNPIGTEDFASGTFIEVPFTITVNGGATPTTECPGDAAGMNVVASQPCGLTGDSIQFYNGDQRKTVTITSTSDFNVDSGEEVVFALGSAAIDIVDPDITVPSATATATITITDNDVAPTSVFVDPPADNIREEGGEVDITVTLSTPAVAGGIDLPFTFVDHTTRDLTATFDTDYTVTFPSDPLTIDCTGPCDSRGGTLAFQPGEQTTTITIMGRDDSEDPNLQDDEAGGSEVVTFQLTTGNYGVGDTLVVDASVAASRSVITLREVTVEMEEIMAQVETVATVIGTAQVGLTTNLIQARFSGVAGAPSAGGAFFAPPSAAGGATTALHLPDNPQDLGDMLGGLGVEHTAEADGGGAYAVWARGQYTSMEGDPTVDGIKFNYDGDSTGLGLGVEWTTARSIAGVALNWLSTDLDLSSDSENTTLSSYEESLLMVAPYLAIKRPDGRSFWVSAGFGTGEADAVLEEGEGTASADVTTTFLNAGADFVLREKAESQLIGGLSALAIRKTVDRFNFAVLDDSIPKMTINTFRMRGDVTYHHPVEIGGKLVQPYVGLATLHDAGDRLNDDSHALDLRGGANFQDNELNLNLELSTELLREDHQSWTISGSGRYQFAPDGLGASLSLDGSHAAESAMGIEGGYGMAMRRVHRAALLTPFAGMRHGSDGDELSSGMRFAVGGEMDADVKATRRLRDAEDTLKLSFRRTF